MREIKFRVWDKTLHKMKNTLTIKQLMEGDFSNTNFGQLVIEQYTGIKDKHGKKIFEGDIIVGQWDIPTEVKFDTKNCWSCGCCNTEFSGTGFMAIGNDLVGSEIVGNIHENPELLEGKK